MIKTRIVANSVMTIGFILFISGCCQKWMPPKEIVGKWSGNHVVTVRTKDNDNHFVFTKAPDSLKFFIEIEANGIVSGKIGNAAMTACKIDKNRGEIGKTLNLATDFVITGNLSGIIFAEDDLPSKHISIPINLNNNILDGSLFQKEGLSMYPMSDIHLRKD